MAERHAPAPRAVGAGISKARNGVPSSVSVRRNLFQSHATRRVPAIPSAAPSDDMHMDTEAAAAATAASASHRDHHLHQQNVFHNHHHLQQHNSQFQPLSDSRGSPSPFAHRNDEDDIVVRDHNGEIELEDPPTPMVDDDPQQLEALEAQHEDEMERQRLAEAVKQHQIGMGQQHGLPVEHEAELVEAVKASLRAKVAELDEDNWLYELARRRQQHR
ncbi:uncharacterized protein C8A04DRAFT_30084 [Dichotomopilus funicola]|uniref:Uncharacterized protein n=1 Tax=Dichotomopilus funicola TaxID=1934379 RepID=A0AAN6V1D8_9PEZI|nr:hypothetical protein C8A04DRAFT_30084 [Dichotomopilus funicola]